MTTSAADTETDADTEAIAGDEAADVAQANPGQEPQDPWTRRIARRWRPIAVVCALLVSVSSATALYFGVYRAEQETAAASTAVIDAASDGSVALLSYAPSSLDADFATARSHLTGEFLTYYSQFADQFVAPAAKQKDINATASVVRAAALDVQPNTAQVLVFINQATTSRDNQEPAQAASAVKVGLTKVDGDWRISSFDPI